MARGSARWRANPGNPQKAAGDLLSPGAVTRIADQNSRPLFPLPCQYPLRNLPHCEPR